MVLILRMESTCRPQASSSIMGFIPAVPDPAKDRGNYFHAKAGMLRPVWQISVPGYSLISEPPAQHLQRELRGEQPHAIAIAGKPELPDLCPVFVSDRNEDNADRLLLRPSARPCDAGNADADGRSRPFPYSLRHRLGDRS